LKARCLSNESRQLAEDEAVIRLALLRNRIVLEDTLGDPKAPISFFLMAIFTNEAKRLLKTKDDVFPTAIKAKRYLKIKELFL